ncbi:MAG: type I DNA topoisomerase [Bacilli bacterium]|nr:type I DNA topoisomerase [Bacilli bacterium]
MSKKLVIVESPHKTGPIGNYLGKDYKVVASKGHIRDLSTKGKFGFGVDTEDHFKPDYVAIKGKKSVITELKKEAKDADVVYLATDPDREGEAISWHLFDALGLKEDKYERVVFNEITKNAVLEAFKNQRKIDQDLVNSQETRRILDRIIGFRLSKLVQSKTAGSSAGRVQSIALKLIVDREREIEAFNAEEYWTITSIFDELEADLFGYKKEKIELKNEKETDAVLDKLSSSFMIESVDKKKKNKAAKYPFITSTMQQDASNKLGFTSKKTMSIAQKLYEGIALEDETVGLISYMRTDSIRLSDDFIKETYAFIDKNYGKEYIGYVKKGKKKENVQDAHEAIRPTSIHRTPMSVKPFLTPDEYKLYRMVYYRALASLMKDAETENTTIILDNNDYKFKTTGQIITFDGYLKVYKDYEDTKDHILPNIEVGQALESEEINKEQHFTKPPARYTEAKLIKEMEELGIGRPSTYAPTMDLLKKRGYVLVTEKKFVPTEIGFEITDKLQQCFSHLINVDYTAGMEDDLDKIAEGNRIWYEVLEAFYKEFEPSVKEAFDKIEKEAPKETGEKCPECGHPLVIRKGRYGEFVACSNFPECKYIKQEPKEEAIICDCPNCDGKIIEKKSRRGKVFYGCNNYPKCKTAYWDKPTGEKCPDCSAMLTIKKDKIKCSSCDYEKEV